MLRAYEGPAWHMRRSLKKAQKKSARRSARPSPRIDALCVANAPTSVAPRRGAAESLICAAPSPQLVPRRFEPDGAAWAAPARQTEFEAAVSSYQQRLTQNPVWIEGHFELGRLFQQQGKLLEAAACFQKCLNLDPTMTSALFSLGCVFALAGISSGSKEADKYALEYFRRALQRSPNIDVANFHVAKLLEDAGRFDEAKPYRDRVKRPQPLDVEPAAEHRRTVLVLCTPTNANTPFRNLLSRSTNSLIAWHVDYATDEQQATLPPYDVAFNAVANPDRDRECIDRTVRFARESARPLLNAPEGIARTRRDRAPALLRDIPDVVAPLVLRLSREQARADDLAMRIQNAGLTFPIIVRPSGHQGGIGATLVERPHDLANIAFEDAEFHYFIQYVDYLSVDGYYRKYRTIFVDRRPLAYHLAISKKWLVHYFSAAMLEESWKREEEKNFLENPEAQIGPRATAALAAIGRRLDLDYAGVDYTVLADGRVLVFEANATMSVYPPHEAELRHKLPHVGAILTAFEEMVERRIQEPRARKPS